MAEQAVNELSTATPNLTDYIMGMSGTAEYKALVSAVAKKIVEDYAGSSLAGSNQSVKSALDTLNSNLEYDSYYDSSKGTNYYKFGRVVMMTISGLASQTVTTGAVIMRIPSGYEPVGRVEFLDTYSKYRLYIENDSQGAYMASQTASGGSIVYLRGSCVYICK